MSCARSESRRCTVASLRASTTAAFNLAITSFGAPFGTQMACHDETCSPRTPASSTRLSSALSSVRGRKENASDDDYDLHGVGEDKRALEMFRRAVDLHRHLEKIRDLAKRLTEQVEGRVFDPRPRASSGTTVTTSGPVRCPPARATWLRGGTSPSGQEVVASPPDRWKSSLPCCKMMLPADGWRRS